MIYRLSSNELWDEINEISKKINKKGGVYLLFCLDAEHENPLPVNRVLTIDGKGILYVGCAISFLDRVINLKKSISDEYSSQSHDCGIRYKKYFKKMFPYENLFLELEFTDNPKIREKEILEKYERDFGELPPLNRIG